ncbi:MAG: AAA family ATPase [Alphaproteobacteria bacterium]
MTQEIIAKSDMGIYSQKITHSTLGKPEVVHDYTDKDGEILFQICRWGIGEGKKILPFSNGKWEGYEKIKPLYNLPKIVNNPAKPILIVEGEKAVEKAQALFPDYVITTSSGGSSSYAKTDWSVLKDLDVVIWRDNDPAGEKYQENITKILYHEVKTKSIKHVEIPDGVFPKKWDLADSIPDGANVNEMLKNAVSLNPLDIGAIVGLSQTELLEMEIPPRKYLLENLISEKSLNMVFAERGIGKTWFAMTLAYTISTGGSFLKWQAMTSSKVLYLDGEMPLKTIQERLRAISKNNPQNENLKILSSDYHPFGLPRIATLEAEELFEEYIAWADVIVLDNLATLYPSTKQNDVEGWLPIQEWLLSLRRRGKSALLVHHSGKNGQQRGSSAKEDILDLSLMLKRPDDYNKKDGAVFEVHFSKARGLFGEDAEPFIASYFNDKWQMREIENKTVLAHKLQGEGLPQRVIAEKIGSSLSSVNRMLKNPPVHFKNKENKEN